MELKQWRGFCLCRDASLGDCVFPPEAEAVRAPFAPLVFLVRRDGLKSRGHFAIDDLSELIEPEDTAALLPAQTRTLSPELETLRPFVRAHGASVLNLSFSRAFSVLSAQKKSKALRVTLVGLGDVGGNVLAALKLLGAELSELAIYDPDESRCRRYELELNQVLSPDGLPRPRVTIADPARLFDCDLFLFTASRGVPPVGTQIADVRMAQYRSNAALLKPYARAARESGFTGLFCQISDPVDHLSRSVFLQSNQKETGEFDFAGLLPEQVQGFGLGVMAARCAYYARQLGLDEDALRVYGPHGQGLVCANCCGEGYDAVISAELTGKTRTANLRVRELGFKPYLAPALSSAAASLLRLVRGQEHYGAVPLGGAYFGCVSRMTRFGPELRREALAPALRAELEKTYAALEAFEY